MFDWLQAQAINIGASFAVTLLLWFGAKKLPNILSNWLSAQIDKVLSAGDDIDDELVLQLCYWAERKLDRDFPNLKAGPVKYLMVADKLISLLPISIRPFVSARNKKIAEVIELNVERLKDELRDRTGK